MTSLLIFIMPGAPGQLAAGAMITFMFLVLTMKVRPYCTGMKNCSPTLDLVLTLRMHV